MSHEGKMRRGQKWWNQRDRDNVLPKGIAEDANKMADVEYYKENSKPKEVPKPKSKEKK